MAYTDELKLTKLNIIQYVRLLEYANPHYVKRNLVVARVRCLVVGLFPELDGWIANVSSPIVSALTMSPRLVMKRLQSNCQARRTDKHPKSALYLRINFSHPKLPHKISTGGIIQAYRGSHFRAFCTNVIVTFTPKLSIWLIGWKRHSKYVGAICYEPIRLAPVFNKAFTRRPIASVSGISKNISRIQRPIYLPVSNNSTQKQSGKQIILALAMDSRTLVYVAYQKQ
ncbi:hypothetical protein T265_07795 [Opisthorchis viverrini]|uniref:Uncharacterized protein n=1 Tax=Opisthorchis viverrini TaxID=6198 RepID=A0A075AAG5_OPIVI|nr:hypothetical protein T265_07795 [Opisthorchis viverrini]KER24559.1 hypothetical protein T265_07795 [Opisthorchis viverrini]